MNRAAWTKNDLLPGSAKLLSKADKQCLLNVRDLRDRDQDDEIIILQSRHNLQANSGEVRCFPADVEVERSAASAGAKKVPGSSPLFDEPGTGTGFCIRVNPDALSY